MDELTHLLSTAADPAPCDVTIFPNRWDTLPSVEYSGLSPMGVCQLVADECGPRTVVDKAYVPYFVPCLLRVAPFVAKTAEKFPGQSGKQRSGSHVTESSWFAFDLDDLAPELFREIVRELAGAGAVFCTYSTHSHGARSDVVRARVLLFADRALAAAQWSDAWHVLNRVVFHGLADKASAQLHQQAGVFATHPERVGKVFRIGRDGARFSTDALLARVPPRKPKPRYRPQTAIWKSTQNQEPKYRAALLLQDANDYHAWQRALNGLRAGVAEGELSESEGLALWLEFSARASKSAQANNDDARYNPELLWERWSRDAEANHLIGALLGASRDAAVREVKVACHAGDAAGDGVQHALRYLRKYHHTTFSELRRELQ